MSILKKDLYSELIEADFSVSLKLVLKILQKKKFVYSWHKLVFFVREYNKIQTLTGKLLAKLSWFLKLKIKF